ncbi:MAG: hypothetical protein QW253_00110 [Metallosphaera sp.]
MLTINGVSSFSSAQTVYDMLVMRDLTVLRDVIIKEAITQIGKISIVPLTAGADALVVRDSANTVDRIVMDEAGNLKLSPLTAGSILFAGSGGLISQDNTNLFWDNTNKRLGIGTRTPGYRLDVNGTGRFTGSLRLDGGGMVYSTFQVSGTAFVLVNNGYFTSYNQNLRFRTDYSGITYNAIFETGNVGIGTASPAEKLHVVGNARIDGEILNAIMNGLRNYAGTAKTVTETSLSVKDEVGPLANRVSLIPMDIEYSADNPSGSGVTLTVVCRAVYTDGTTTDLRTDQVNEGGTLSVSFTPDGLCKLLSDGKVLQKIQLLAYCSATPAATYEPTVTLTRVAGLSF